MKRSGRMTQWSGGIVAFSPVGESTLVRGDRDEFGNSSPRWENPKTFSSTIETRYNKTDWVPVVEGEKPGLRRLPPPVSSRHSDSGGDKTPDIVTPSVGRCPVPV